MSSPVSYRPDPLAPDPLAPTHIPFSGADHAVLANVTHELRTPLTAIRGALDLIGSGALGPLAEPVVRLLTVARANSDRLLRLIDDVLTAEATGHLTMRKDVVDLGALVTETETVNAGLFAGRDGAFHIAATLNDALAWGDRGRLLQVLTNLVSNAVKFSPVGAPVTMALQRREARYRISVTDQGPGIPRDFWPCVFQRFARAPTTAAGTPGNGLGLHIARAIVTQHDGEIGFECLPDGGGTRFYVDLPILTPADDSSKI